MRSIAIDALTIHRAVTTRDADGPYTKRLLKPIDESSAKLAHGCE
jgi:hypothetical protein